MKIGKAKKLLKLLQQEHVPELLYEVICTYRGYSDDIGATEKYIVAEMAQGIMRNLERKYTGIIGEKKPLIVHKDLEDSIRECKEEKQKKEQ